MRRVALIAVLALVASGCGGTEAGGSGNAGDALAYLPSDAATVLFLSTDVDGDQWNAVDEHVYRPAEAESDAPRTLDGLFEETARRVGLDWQDDVKPLLGDDIVVAVEGDPLDLLGGDGESTITAALDTSGGDVDEVLEKAKLERAGEANGATLYSGPGSNEIRVAVEDGVLVFGEDEVAVRRAVERRDSGDGIDESAVEDGLAGLPENALVRGYGSLDDLKAQETFRRFAGLPLVEGLESWGLAVTFRGAKLDADLALRLDESKVDEGDLPLVTGAESPEVVIRDRELSGGNRNQSQTTAFLLRALRIGYPDSRFVKAADAIEQKLGIDFEQEILRQFNGPSASYVSPDGEIFAARSEVRDPDALREVLPKIAPHLPPLIEGLQGLQSEGMGLLFLFAPDAPAAAPMSDVKVEPPATADGFYRVSGLTGAGPSELYFGLVDDVFVVASDEQRAREIATADTRAVDEAKGAGVLRADLTGLAEEAFRLPFPLAGKELVASLEASTKELRARLRVELD